MKTICGFMVVALAFLPSCRAYAQDGNAADKIRVTSLTVFPVSLAGEPERKVAEAVGLVLDKEGFKKIEIADETFKPGKGSDFEKTASDFGAFVAKHPIKTDYALYGEIIASREQAIKSRMAEQDMQNRTKIASGLIELKQAIGKDGDVQEANKKLNAILSDLMPDMYISTEKTAQEESPPRKPG